MSKAKWHDGPPPSVGWWPASVCQDSSVVRWWDGKRWSIGAEKGFRNEDTITFAASTPSSDSSIIQWTTRPNYWPKRSRT